MNKTKETKDLSDEAKKAQSEVKKEEVRDKRNFFKKGGVYFHSASIISNKSVFVTDDCLSIMTNALQSAEIKKDIKNLAYVIMPNYIHWIFRLGPKQDNPFAITSELKGEVAREVIKSLCTEVKEERNDKLAEFFEKKDTVHRCSPEKILWTFEERAKDYDTGAKMKVWVPKGEVRLLENDEQIAQKLEVIRKTPTRDRWQFSKEGNDYPYLYVSDELLENPTLLEKLLPIAKGMPAQVPVSV
jgi:REP element-mobilizing transposase RayT